MKELFYATTNAGKVRTLQNDFAAYNIKITQVQLNIPEPRSSDVREIAREKVRRAFVQLQKPVVVLDAGFYIHSLNGFPRAFVNFVLATIGIEGILKLVEDKPRACEFRECLAYCDAAGSEPRFFMRYDKGTLAAEPRGKNHSRLWSPLGLIFIPEGRQHTLGELSESEYQAWENEVRIPIKPTDLFLKR